MDVLSSHARALTLELIEELEAIGIQGKMKGMRFEEEQQWMRKLVENLPVLRALPKKIKDRLAVGVGDWKDLPINRRQRKRGCREMDAWFTSTLVRQRASHQRELGNNKEEM